jgi:hypothetical protein
MYSWFLTTFFKKYPVPTILAVGMIIGGVAWLQLNATDNALQAQKVSRDELLRVEHKVDTLSDKVSDIQADVAEVNGKMDMLLKYFAKEKPNGDEKKPDTMAVRRTDSVPR